MVGAAPASAHPLRGKAAMSESSRRTFLKHSAVALTSLAGAGSAAAQPPAAPAARAELDAARLGAIGAVVLPSELGPKGVERVVGEFRAWVEGFEPVAELPHGYGTDQIRYGPADPAPQWQAQLEALELEARKRFSTAFADLPAGERRAMLRRDMARDPLGALDPISAPHVATALMGHFFQSPEAVDLCYRARIEPYRCRGLATAPDRPEPLPTRE